MTEKIFWRDPYLTELTAKVAALNGNELRLDRTIFFAESGGQESDEGTIGGIPVIAATMLEGGDIIYRLAQAPAFMLGDEVAVKIDWKRRYRLMRLHFAAEIVLELVYRDLARPEKIGAHIAADKARIDFLFSESIQPHLADLEQKANAIVEANQPIESNWADQAPDDEVNKERRYWRIEGFAQVPCGGTHLKKTGEIGRISLKRRNIGKGKERIEIRAESNQDLEKAPSDGMGS